MGLTLLLDVLAALIFFRYQSPPAYSVAAFVVFVLLATGFAMDAWVRAPVGYLRWDGNGWHWSGFECNDPCALRLQMDFQSVLIVSLHPIGGPARWLWLEAVPGSTDWLPLRRAVVGSQRVGAVESNSQHAVFDQVGR